ncbi:beta-lactamase family protein [Lysobacter arenosi]|uniref:Beta-lactamase family protein n=1 Tax=Lysobacter arenosi TaxID=2795387 RepID=A0ABX7R778_9GAMM|nr:serine hydrolase domain-containing protein [Lysobacter arenosi]QSX73973.1 beta-lactamase family protein [Lysobacter arenosi]
MASRPKDGTGAFPRGSWLVLAYLFLLLPLQAAAGMAPAQRHALHATMAEQLRGQQLQGAVWALVTQDGGIVTDAAGIRDTRDGAALGADDRVHVGSIAKTLLATGVLHLVSQKRLTLDTPVSTLLPGIAFDNPWQASDPVRVRHLLDHTSGLDDARFSQVFSLKADADAPLANAFARSVPLQVRSRPGSRHSYSNSGYTLLGMVVEAVVGSRYEAYLDANLLRPLGMHDSTFAFTTQEGAGADPRLAMGHFEAGKRQFAVPIDLRPASQFTTTAADMGRLARFLMSDGRIDGATFIDTALLQSMGQPVATEAARGGLRVGYGLGLATRDRHGAVGKCHGGSTVGYRAMLCLFPARQLAFFVAVNADVEGADYGRLDRALVDALGVQTHGKPVTAAPVDISRWSGYYIPSPNRFASFAWLDTTLNFVRVRGDRGGLILKPFQSPELTLVPAGGALFRAADRTIPSHVALTLGDGRGVISTGLQSYEQTSLLKLALLWTSLAAGLLGLVWLLLAGVTRLVAAPRALVSRPVFAPLLGVLALLVPLPFFLRQSFLQLGDLTVASALLFAVTLLLPVTMLIGLAVAYRRRPLSTATRVELLAMLAVLQWALVLMYWGLLPLRLWA